MSARLERGAKGRRSLPLGQAAALGTTGDRPSARLPASVLCLRRPHALYACVHCEHCHRRGRQPENVLQSAGIDACLRVVDEHAAPVICAGRARGGQESRLASAEIDDDHTTVRIVLLRLLRRTSPSRVAIERELEARTVLLVPLALLLFTLPNLLDDERRKHQILPVSPSSRRARRASWWAERRTREGSSHGHDLGCAVCC